MDQRSALKESLGNFLRNLGDLMVLNWLWFFLSLPVLTIGPATCALYAVTLKLARGEPVHSVRDFFRAFREGWKQSFLLGLIAVLLLIVAGGDVFFALGQTGLFRTVFLVVGVIMGAVFLTFIIFAFPLQAMFQNPLKKHVLNAFALSIVSPGRTLQMWLITLLPVLALLLLPPIAIRMLGFLYLVMGVSGPVYVNSRILRGIFDKVNGGPVVPEPPEPEDEEQ